MLVNQKIKRIIHKILNDLEQKLFGKDSNEVCYIGGSEVLPPPLSAEEERELLERWEDDAEAVKKILIERNLRLVVYIAKKFENTSTSVEDLISIGTIGLIKAVNTFDPGKNIKLATYASRCIENEILMHLRRSSKIKAEVSFDEPLNVDWEGMNYCCPIFLGRKEIPFTNTWKMKSIRDFWMRHSVIFLYGNDELWK